MKRLESAWIILGVALCLYLPFLSNPFIYDDFHSLAWNRLLSDQGSWVRILTDPSAFSSDPEKAMYRPLLLLSYLINGVAGFSPASYRVGNLLLHLACGVVVYNLTWWLVDMRGAKYAMALFLLHPVFSEPVFYLCSRSDSLMVLCAGVALWMYSRSRYGWATLFSGLAMLSKETAVMLPAVFLLYDYTIGAVISDSGYKRVYKRVYIRRAIYPTLFVAAGYLALLCYFGTLSGAGSRAGRTWNIQFWTQAAGIREYALSLLWPVHWGIEGTLPAAVGPTLVGFLSLMLVAAGCWWAWQKKGIRLFLWGGFWLTLLPVLVIPLNILVADRRLYWPGTFLCIGAGAMIASLERKFGRRVQWVAIVVFGLLALGTYQRGGTWAEPTKLWAQAMEVAPDSYRGLMNYGTELAKQGSQADAEVVLKRAIAVSSTPADKAQALGNLGSLYFTAGRLDSAFFCYVESIHQDSTQADTWANLGVLWTEMGKKSPTAADRKVRWTASEQFLQQALKLSPQHYQAHIGLANLYESTGRQPQAEEQRRLLAGLKPAQVLVPYTGGK